MKIAEWSVGRTDGGAQGAAGVRQTIALYLDAAGPLVLELEVRPGAATGLRDLRQVTVLDDHLALPAALAAHDPALALPYPALAPRPGAHPAPDAQALRADFAALSAALFPHHAGSVPAH